MSMLGTLVVHEGMRYPPAQDSPRTCDGRVVINRVRTLVAMWRRARGRIAT
jgi:hypothetical protein